MKKQTKRAILGLALVGLMAYAALGYYGYVPFFDIHPEPKPEPPLYKTVDVYGKVVDQEGDPKGATTTVALYDELGTDGVPVVSPLTSDACDATGEFILTSVPSNANYWLYIYDSSGLFWRPTYPVTIDGVLKTSEETSVRFTKPFVLPLIATVYRESIECGSIINSRTEAGEAMTAPNTYAVTAGVATEFTFKTTVGTYSTRAYEWSLPRYSNINLRGVWMVCSNQTFQVVSCPYNYATYGASGVANYTLVFDASAASADDTSITVSQTLKLKWATAIGSPSFEVYFLWNTTVSALKSALCMAGADGTHLTAPGVASPIPGYNAGLFQVTDGTYCSIDTV